MLSVDVEVEFTCFVIKIDSSGDATYLVREVDWENIRSVVDVDALAVEVRLVEGDVDSLAVGNMLGKQRVPHSFHKELKCMGSVKKVLVVKAVGQVTKVFSLPEDLKKIQQIKTSITDLTCSEYFFTSLDLLNSGRLSVSVGT